jgi:hypothetical protein
MRDAEGSMRSAKAELQGRNERLPTQPDTTRRSAIGHSIPYIIVYPRLPRNSTSNRSSDSLLSQALRPIAVRPRSIYHHQHETRHITSRNVQDPFLGRFRCAYPLHQPQNSGRKLIIITGIAVRVWQLGIEMRPIISPVAMSKILFWGGFGAHTSIATCKI